MHARANGVLGLILLAWATEARADDLVWKGAKPAAAPAAVSLGRPQPLAEPPADAVEPASFRPVNALVRSQAPDPLLGNPPPPPAFPGGPGGPPTAIAVAPGTDPYNCGIVNSDADKGFFSKCGQRFRRCWTDVSGGVTGIFQPAQGRSAFQSDHCFDNFISPVTNPFYFEDPRSLTEIRPIFIWQRTPDSNPVFAGGDNFFFGAQGRLALTPYLSLVVHKLGYVWTEIQNPASGFNSHAGLSELHLGPKVTFLRNENTGTVGAAGLAFEVPIGPEKVFQNTGNLTLRPYFSVAQNFWRTSYGSMNFMNTTGYCFGVDDDRSDNVFASFHLDYDVANIHRIYPLVELNYVHYTQNGNARSANFEGRDLFNFGAADVSGLDELTAAVGLRYVFTQAVQAGVAIEFNVLDDNGRRLDDYRITADMIFRY